MRRVLPWVAACVVALWALPADAVAGDVDLPRYPSVSPDGAEVVFSWRGDLWKASATGGHATRLTSHRAVETRSAWSPDGKHIAFTSDRSGYWNLHVMDADGSNVRQVTHEDTSCSLSGFGKGGTLLFHTRREGDVYRENRPYAVSIDGGPIRRIHGAFGRMPRVSPDGTQVCFTRGGSSWSRRGYRGPDNRNVWLYSPAGDAFEQLTDWKGNDGNAHWTGNGTLVFLSDRELDRVNVYRLARGGEPQRLTSFADDDVWDLSVSGDGSTAVFVVWDRLYRLDLGTAGAQPVALELTAADDEGDRYELKNVSRTVSEARLSPDGKVMAFVAFGEVFVRHMDDKQPTRRVTDHHAREKHIAWSPDGERLYFVSDRGGHDAIYAATVERTRKEIKEAYEKATKPPEPEKPEEPPEEEKEETAEPKDGDGDEKADGDEKKDDDDDGKDKKKKDKDEYSRWQDGIRFTVEPVVQLDVSARRPQPSPDGKRLAFLADASNVLIRDLATGRDLTLVTGWDKRIDFRWSPDGHHMAYSQNDRNFNADVWIKRTDGSGEAVNVSRHPVNDVGPRWSADGKVLCFVSQRRNREYDVWRVYLDASLEGLTPTELQKYYDDAAKAAKKRKPLKPGKGDKKKKEKEPTGPPELDLDDAYKRLVRLTTLPGDEMGLEITPAGDRFVFSGKESSDGIFSIRWDGKELKRLAGKGRIQQVSLTGDKVIYVASDRAGHANPASGGAKTVDITDTIRLDREALSSQKFLEAARVVGEVFYHPTMKDRDWPALTAKYHALASRARTADEFNYVARYLLGELNASHLGVYARGPSSPVAQSNGRLGIDHDPVAEGFRVTRVLPRSPSERSATELIAGDLIVAIASEGFAPADTLESRLKGRAGKETVVTVRRALDGAAEPVELELLITPISSRAETRLRYDAWKTRNGALVTEWSGGRLGYLHIRGMSQPSLDEFERDLYAAAEGKDGLLVDVRNNGGGWTADLVLASIMVRPHAYTVPRGADPAYKRGYPRDRLFIQRYTMPMNMLCNEKSFSNAEIVSHAFKTLERGNLVGQQTYGGVISTGSYSLVDGTRVRTPFRGWYVIDGDVDMENNGAIPDILVPQTPEAESAGEDEQLRAAVTDLLKRL